ncbi:hypothetical protein [Slackia heliotrinireducens]|uniref:hypothetical protein n=1 Tax=Slackia heliotrinireducens TaxID=84110 RepID=UPI003314DF54
MSKKESQLEKAQRRAEEAIKETNEAIERLGSRSSRLYDALGALQDRFDRIRNVPESERLEYERVKSIRLSWKQQAEKIEADYTAAKAGAVGKGVAGAGAGVAVAAMGPTAAMGIATTFGVASTGTAISTLSGAAATNAALAWLGGGALAAGGGGMAAGEAMLALAGPVGWAIAGVALLGSGALLIKGKMDQGRIEQVFTLVSKRDEKSYELAIVELEERIRRIDDETGKLEEAVARIDTFGLDYSEMAEEQQYELGSYVNLMNSSTQLLVNPILGLQPKYTEEDLDEFISAESVAVEQEARPLVIALCNFLYGIDIDSKDASLLYKSFRKNKAFLEQFGLKKADFDAAVMETVERALSRKRELSESHSQ